MLALSKDSYPVRYAYFWSDKYRHTGPPDTSSLCAFFWRCVISTVLWAVPVAFASFATHVLFKAGEQAFFGSPAPVRPWHPPTVTDSWWGLSVCLCVIVAFTGIILAEWMDTYPEGWFATVFWGIKRRVCPIVELRGAPQPEDEVITRLRNVGLIATKDASGGIDVASSTPAWPEFWRAQETLGPDWEVSGCYEDGKATLTIARRKGAEA